jgi:hypothetical protein
MIKQSRIAEKVRIAGISTSQFLWEMTCDFCQEKLSQKGREAGDLHALGLKFGWKIITDRWFRPCKWQCSSCQAKAKNGVQN